MFRIGSKPIKFLCALCQHQNDKKILSRNYSKNAMASKLVGDLNEIFGSGVSAVQPKTLFQTTNFHVNEAKSAIICSFNEVYTEVDIRGKQCHLVGFGKAVFGMASALSEVLGERLKSGIISIPLHTQQKFSQIRLPSTIQVFEGAKNNLPDAAAERAAIKIVEFVENLNKNDVLFVLISGGGSALLPLPCAGVTLDEKLDIIKNLASKGAPINDINRVRIDLSRTKGGKLAVCAKQSHQVIALIISDIIDDPIDLIASGPTVVKALKHNEINSIDILKKYRLWQTVPSHIQNTIALHSASKVDFECKNVQNIVIANNCVAVNGVLEALKQKGIIGIVLSTQVEGNVSEISKLYHELSKLIQMFKLGMTNENEFNRKLLLLQKPLRIRDNFLKSIVNVITQAQAGKKDFCLIAAGEPTVEVTGTGLGGRNQELALRFSQLAFPDKLLHDICLLSAGTDGIDGPTSAAGAIGGSDIIRDYITLSRNSPSDVDEFVQNNDSFTFYSNLCNGKYHVVTGHTGTNVMDLHLLYFSS